MIRKSERSSRNSFLNGPANLQTTAIATYEVVIRHNINRNFRFFITDSRAYCYKAFTDHGVITRFYSDAIWIGCWVHFVDFLGDAWQACFEFSMRAIMLFKKASSSKRLVFLTQGSAARFHAI